MVKCIVKFKKIYKKLSGTGPRVIVTLGLTPDSNGPLHAPESREFHIHVVKNKILRELTIYEMCLYFISPLSLNFEAFNHFDTGCGELILRVFE